jgi:hypothetical protein
MLPLVPAALRLLTKASLRECTLIGDRAASQCQRTIDAFWKKIGKYQPALRGTGPSSKIKEGWLKIKWAVCRKEDIANFKADLVGHTESIQLLLTTVQM